jgi:uncharacterized protein
MAAKSQPGWEIAQQLAALQLIEPVQGSRHLKQSQPQTLTAWLHITNECNLRCDYCYLAKSPDDMELSRGKEAVEAVFRAAVLHRFQGVKLKYAGGEATLNFPLVVALHEHARQLAEKSGLKLEGVILSNGLSLTDRMIEAILRLGLRVMISLDGVGEYHDRQRHFANGRGSFTHVERALDRLEKHHLLPMISITLSARNLAGLPQAVEYVLKRKLPFTLNFYRDNDCASPFSDLKYQDEQIIAAMRDTFAMIEGNLPPYSLLGVLVDRANLNKLHERPCGAGHSYVVIDQKGQVAKCHMEIEKTVTTVATIDILDSVRTSPQGVQNLPVDEREGCKSCTWRYWCAGGCPLLTYRITGRFDVKSPNCRVYLALFPDVLRLEGLRLLRYSNLAPD